MINGDYQDRARGMLVGLAVGDALGAPYEFGYTSELIKERGDEIAHLHSSMILPTGAWTDDTSMALCLADSLLEKDGYDSYDIMDKFRKWVVFGYRSFDEKPAFDVGTQTANAIGRFHKYPVIAKDEPKTESAGNGAIMRLAPIVIANASSLDLEHTLKMAELSCRETHDSIMAIAVTRIFAKALYYALQRKEKREIVDYCKEKVLGKGYDNLFGRALEKDGEILKNLGGYIVDAFTIALWGFLRSNTFRDGMIEVIRLGGDTDTNAACYGQLAGAYYGYEAIPKEWRDNIQAGDELVELADKLFGMKKCPVLKTRFEDDDHFVAPN